MKIALVHDHLLEFGGAERVLVDLKNMFPKADVFVAAYDKDVVTKRISDFDSWNIKTSWAARIPFYKKLYSPLRFLTPWIWESFDFSSYDIVISSSGWFSSKGIITADKTKHISYIHHPPSFLYGYQTAIEWQKYWPVKIYAMIVNHFLRVWDYKAAQRPDVLVANSKETQRRITKFYRRKSQVVYPAVHFPKKEPAYSKPKEKYYIVVSRLGFKKHVDVIVKAANQFGFDLKVVGSGRDEAFLRKIAGPTVEMLGYVDDAKFDEIFNGATAFLNAAVEEEFGIAPVEAMGRGLPVIAYASGGLLETVKDGKNGYLFRDLTPESLYKKIQKLEKLTHKEYIAMKKTARKESKKYTFDVFSAEMRKIVL